MLSINGITYRSAKGLSVYTAGQILDSYMYHGTSIIVIYTEFSTTGSWNLLDVKKWIRSYMYLWVTGTWIQKK